MTIYVRYGTYQHQPGEVEYSFQREVLLNEREVAYAYRTTVQMQGLLLADSTDDMNVKVRSLEAAYSRSDRDWVVEQDGQALEVSIYDSNTISGVTITGGVSYPTNRNAAYVTILPYEINLTADVIIESELFALRSFEETLRFSGGGPRFLHIETAVGRPVKQLGRRNTIYRAVQSGSAVGLYRRPVVPRPIFPGALVESPETEYDSGVYRGDTLTDLSVSWVYRYESALPLSGRPNVWGRT